MRIRLRRIITNPVHVALTGIVVVALLLRLWGIGLGLPYEYHVDEQQYVRQAASMGGRGLEPVWWNNPPFFKYVLLGEYASLFIVGKLLGWYASTGDFGAQSTLDPTWLYLLGRATSALFGTLTVLVVYWLGRKAHGPLVGLLAAWFLAICFIHVRDSHYAVNDAVVTFLVTVVLLAAVGIVQTGKIRWYALAGGALGLGVATKYSAIFALTPILLAHLISPGVRWRAGIHLQPRRLVMVLVVTVLAAIVASPYFALVPGKVIHDAYGALVLAGQQGFDGWQIDPAGGYVFYLTSLAWGLGWGLLLLALMGLVIAVLRHSPESLVLLSLPVVVYAFMGRQQMYFARFVLPLVPVLLVLGAASLETIVVTLTRNQRRLGTSLLLAGALVVTVQPLVSSLRSDYLLTQTDTRTMAKHWIEAHIPGGTQIAVDWPIHGPPLSTPEKAAPGSQRTYEVLLVGEAGLSEHSLEWYQQQGFDYLIASSFIYDIPLLDERRDAERREFYLSLDRESTLVQEFRPYTGHVEPAFIFDEMYGPAISLWQRERPGPTIKVYAVNR